MRYLLVIGTFVVVVLSFSSCAHRGADIEQTVQSDEKSTVSSPTTSDEKSTSTAPTNSPSTDDDDSW